MKVVLLQDIKGLGKKFDVKDVSEGYARNFLLAGKKAELATPKILADLEDKKTLHLREKMMKEDLIEKSLQDLHTKTITISGKTNEKGHLFSSIHVKDIRDEIENAHRISLLEKNVILEKSIKEVGEYDVMLSVGNKKATIHVSVQEEK